MLLWGVIRAVFDPLHKGTDPKGIVERVGYAVSGLSYMLLAFATYGLITGGASAARNGAQAAQTQQTTASILSKSWGPWVVGIAAVIVIGVGLSQIFQGLRRDFERQFQPYALSSSQRKWIDRLGRFGTAARGVVFTLVGMFLFLAAYHHDPSQAKGIDGVLAALLHQPYGAVAAGRRRVGAGCLRDLFGHERHLAAVQKMRKTLLTTDEVTVPPLQDTRLDKNLSTAFVRRVCWVSGPSLG